MKISLIIPAYNEEKYLGDCLLHAIRNSRGAFSEIIVIDNASTDNTRGVAESFPGVRVVREEKKGLTQARQRGFLEAQGDILAYIDADTRMQDGWTETLVREFKNKKISTLSGRYIYYDIPKFNQFLVWIYWYLLGMPTYWIVGYMTVGGNFAIRRSVVEKMGGFDTSIAFYGEDTDIARRASKFGKVKFKPGFAMETSGRRLQKEGLLRTSLTYASNLLSQVIFHKPTTQEYTDHR